MVLSKTAYNSS